MLSEYSLGPTLPWPSMMMRRPKTGPRRQSFLMAVRWETVSLRRRPTLRLHSRGERNEHGDAKETEQAETARPSARKTSPRREASQSRTPGLVPYGHTLSKDGPDQYCAVGRSASGHTPSHL